MATLCNERHLRYILLLCEGGTLVLREILKQEKTKSGKTLEELLQENQAILRRTLEKHTFTKVFDPNGHLNENTWDISLLATVILQIFKDSINDDKKYKIAQLKDKRNQLAHASSLSMDVDEYDDYRKELSYILIKLTNGLDREVHDRCQNFIKDFTIGPIDIQSATERVKEFSKYDEIICTELGNISTDMKDVKQMLMTLLAQNRDDFHSFEVFGFQMAVKGPNENYKELAEKAITCVFNAALRRIGGEENDSTQLELAVKAILQEIENCSGVEVTDVEHKCILIKLRCTNCKGLLALLEYLESSLFKRHLCELATSLKMEYNEQFSICSYISRGDLWKIIYNFKEVNDMASNIEARLRTLRNEFEKCIKDPSLVSQLASKAVITEVDASRIKNMYMDRVSLEATRELLDLVFKSEAAGKWRSFEDSLESADYPYLKELLLSQDSFNAFSSNRAQKIICLFAPDLEKSINSIEFVSELHSKGIINNTDVELIQKTYETKGNIYSSMILLDRMQCRKSPEEWYYAFLEVLMKKNYQHLVEQIEPDFIKNPSAFMPKLGAIMPEKREDVSSKRSVPDEEEGACGSIHEHVLEARGEGHEDMNDLGAPAIFSERQDSVTLSSKYTVDNLGANLKELNIKPESLKYLSQAEQSDGNKTGPEIIKANNQDANDTDDEDNSMDSDFDNTEAQDEASSSHTAALLNLRAYQLELAENAVLGRNTIICAETGSGKTWVALHIVQKHLEQAANGPRKVVFMARTGALITQQSGRFKKYLPQFQTKLITGEDDKSRMLNMFLENYDILCFTPQILVNNLEEGVIKSLSEFSLLILDECHHTRGDGPYSTLMRKYLVEKSKTKKELPQIVGLTASIGVGKSRTDQETVDYIIRVCACLDVRLISTVERNFKELKKHVNVPDEETIQLVKQKDDPCKHVILTAMEETEETLLDNSLMQPDMIDLMDKQPRDRESQEYNKWTVDVMKTALLKVDDYDVSRDISSCAKYLNIYNSALEVNKLLLSRDVIKYLAEKHRLEGENKDKLTQTEKDLFRNLQNVQKNINAKAKSTENPNVRILSDTLRKMLEEKGEESRAMVFVKARATCKSLAVFLDRDLQNSGVKASPLYGKENRGGDDGMTENQQTDILEKFRSGHFKVLVCTSVGNEGIDVPDCNIVLSYEYSGDEITKIQMKGRARKKKATTITMGSDKVVEQEMINTYKAAMMYRAMNIVKQLDPKFINMKVNAFQSEETHKYRFKAEVEKLKKGRKSDEDYEILCGRCNTFACFVSDVRQLGHDHIVIDKDFVEKITRKPHNKPKTYDGLHKKYKMFCKKCPLDWGIIGIRDGLDCMILKIINFKFRNRRTQGVSNYKKWIDVPYNVPEIKLGDLTRLLGPAEDA